MKTALLKIALRQNAIFIPQEPIVTAGTAITETTAQLLANVAKLGFTFSEPLLHALNNVVPAYKLAIVDALKEVTGAHKNWTPLVKGWNIPTGERFTDHLMTFLANVFKAKGTAMPCGHVIPVNTFPLERYNGCPFCGTPFVFGEIETYGQASKLKVLELWLEKELQSFYIDLLTSKTALDATQQDSMKVLLQYRPIPEVTIGMKETLMLLIDACKDNGDAARAQVFFKTPADILRYLWYKKTGYLQVIEPKTIIKKAARNHTHLYVAMSQGAAAAITQRAQLKLKYSRKECAVVASWLNNLDMEADKACEMMHPKRGMWVRLIRALRLPEYARRKGFERLKELLDVFYNKAYEVWQGDVDQYRLRYDTEKTFALLQQRPGLFARSLFANMLWFGGTAAVEAFSDVADRVPARLILTLNMYAQQYFDRTVNRSVKPLGGISKYIPANRLLVLYSDAALDTMKAQVEQLCLDVMRSRFIAMPNANKKMAIDPALYNMPVAIGDRSDTVQDLPVALMGTKFPLEGNEVRLFMQWGKDLPAQHLDMDLSCQVAYPDRTEFCSFSQLVITGCKHSGDIQYIPNKTGTAEYININVDELKEAGALYVTFTCNAYSNGNITPNLVVGWMDSRYPMKISQKTGVAYDPSCVQHQVRITQNAAKGLVFGVLDVLKRDIVWLEMTFGGQIVQRLDLKGVNALLAKLSSKLSIGALLQLKAEAQGMRITGAEEAEEVYDLNWARNAAAVTQLLID